MLNTAGCLRSSELHCDPLKTGVGADVYRVLGRLEDMRKLSWWSLTSAVLLSSLLMNCAVLGTLSGPLPSIIFPVPCFAGHLSINNSMTSGYLFPIWTFTLGLRPSHLGI